MVDGLIEALKWALNKIVTLVLKAFPAIGVVMGFIIGSAFAMALDCLFSVPVVKKITSKFESLVNTKTYSAWQYLASFFQSVKSSK